MSLGSPLMRLQTPFIGHSNPQHISSKHFHVIFANGDNYLQFMKEVFSNKTFKSNYQSINCGIQLLIVNISNWKSRHSFILFIEI